METVSPELLEGTTELLDGVEELDGDVIGQEALPAVPAFIRPLA